MEILVLLAILVAVLNCLTVQVLVIRSFGTRQTPPCQEQLSPEEQEARRLAAEAQAKYEQGFVNLMCYDGMPAKKREGVFE